MRGDREAIAEGRRSMEQRRVSKQLRRQRKRAGADKETGHTLPSVQKDTGIEETTEADDAGDCFGNGNVAWARVRKVLGIAERVEESVETGTSSSEGQDDSDSAIEEDDEPVKEAKTLEPDEMHEDTPHDENLVGVNLSYPIARFGAEIEVHFACAGERPDMELAIPVLHEWDEEAQTGYSREDYVTHEDVSDNDKD